MKIKKIIKVYYMILVAVLLLGSCGPKNGFVKEDGRTFYYVNGEKQYGWLEIDGDWYYFAEHKKDYFYERGEMLTLEFLDYNGSTYCFGPDGKMLKNLFAIRDSKNIYFGSDGKQLFNTEITVEGQKYTIDSNGIAKEAPYYSAPAPMGGTYNFYLKQPLPLSISYGKREWVIESPLIFEQFRFGNYISISGIIELHGTDEIAYSKVCCRLSKKSENGLTSAEEKGLHYDNIAGGEKTRFEVSFDNLPLAGCDIYVEFYY